MKITVSGMNGNHPEAKNIKGAAGERGMTSDKRVEEIEEKIDTVMDILHSFHLDCLQEPYEGDPLARRRRKRIYAKDIIDKTLTQYHQDLMSEVVEKLEGRIDHKLYGFSVIVSEDPNPSEDYKKGFLLGYNTAIRDAQTIIKSK